MQYEVARLRLKRAISHGEHLAQLWNDLPSDQLCAPRAKMTDANGNCVLAATNIGDIPDELPLLLGEQLYQLRSALDACIYQATVYATKQNPPPDEGKLEFPITTNSKEWPDLVKRRLSALPASIQNAIERVQPYNNQSLPPDEMVKSINRSLGILHDLARKDRHRKLHIVGSWPLGMKPDFILPDGVTVDSFEALPPSVLKEGTVMARFRISGLSGHQQISFNPNLRTNIGSDEPPPPCHPSDTFDRRLAEMINAVGSVIAAFETHY